MCLEHQPVLSSGFQRLSSEAGIDQSFETPYWRRAPSAGCGNSSRSQTDSVYNFAAGSTNPKTGCKHDISHLSRRKLVTNVTLWPGNYVQDLRRHRVSPATCVFAGSGSVDLWRYRWCDWPAPGIGRKKWCVSPSPPTEAGGHDIPSQGRDTALSPKDKCWTSFTSNMESCSHTFTVTILLSENSLMSQISLQTSFRCKW